MRIPAWTSLSCSQGRSTSASESRSTSCQLCTGPTFAARIALRDKALRESQGPVFGPPNRPRPRSRSVNRARFRTPLPLNESKEPEKFPKIFASTQYRPSVPTQPNTSRSSSGPEPMSTSTLSQDSSTLSTECDLDAFSFDSETSVDASPNNAGKVNESVKKEVNEKKKETYGVVALRNPNTVAICMPSRIIRELPPKASLEISDTNGSLDKHTPSAPSSAFSDSLKKLRTMAGIIKVREI
ncbi:hypothetical protein KIN20_003898 [Parelaphostrongylus tenuis]|uniref:Uncharacterized protein n=1 Tax=Parelaphostrongylus tenuis TaxID=148309 RepID=A0AAD5QIX3_PARTN|nr:hypothetical protein KIN20_003898 [Parelaphostrongylus tenuis]